MILRCSDGHLSSAARLKLVFLSAHFIDEAWLRCPVDHKWRMASRIEASALSETELYEAQRHRF
jgi:hypothetical protein